MTPVGVFTWTSLEALGALPTQYQETPALRTVLSGLSPPGSGLKVGRSPLLLFFLAAGKMLKPY